MEMLSLRNLSKVFITVMFIITVSFVMESIAQSPYPNGPVTMVVVWGPGMADTMVRAICQVAEKKLGQPIIVENKPGAAGALGTNYVVKAEPDGYTIGVTATSVMSIIPHIRKLPFNPLTDATDICSLYKFNHGLAVRSDAPWKTYEDVIAYARKNPEKFTYANPGVGSTQHLIMEMIAMKEGIKWTMVPYKSGGDSMLACLGGHANACTLGSVDLLPQIKAEKLRLLLSLNDFRWPLVPDVPNILEKGYDFYAFNFNTIVGPKGIPEHIRQKLENVFKDSLKDPSLIEFSNKFGVEIKFMEGKEYSKLWRSKYSEREKIIKGLRLRGE
jgi:tripartite-type tricarboxylate transporter receptor subunit TctC